MKFEKDDGLVAMAFRRNTIPRPIEFYPVGGMLSDGTVRAINKNHKSIMEGRGDRNVVRLRFNNGLFASSTFTDDEAKEIFERSNFKVT